MNIQFKQALAQFNRDNRKTLTIGCAYATLLFLVNQIPVFGGVLSWIAALPMAGYLLRYAANTIANSQETELPQWKDLSKLLVDGLRIYVLILIQVLGLVIVPLTVGLMTVMIMSFAVRSAVGFEVALCSGAIAGGIVFLAMLPFFAVFSQLSYLRLAATDRIGKALNIFSLVHLSLQQFLPILVVSLVWVLLGVISCTLDNMTISNVCQSNLEPVVKIIGSILVLVFSPLVGSLQFSIALFVTNLWAQAYAQFNAYELGKSSKPIGQPKFE
jgi:hypothetical protein